jgi:hypothetical protein
MNSVEKLGKFLETYNLTRLNREAIAILNIAIRNTEAESVNHKLNKELLRIRSLPRRIVPNT